MPIYSRNRTGFMEAAQTPADTSYGVNDFGRILCEIQQNDMAFFEAILQADFNEVKGLNEGTILESEVAALNEASKNNLIQKLIERAKKFWEKIKGIFKNAIDNIATYAHTKAGELSSKISNTVMGKIKNWNGSITIRTFDHTHKVFDIDLGHELNKFSGVNSWDEPDNNSNASKYTSADICAELLYNNLHSSNGAISSSEFNKKAIEVCSSELIVDKSNINALKSELTNARYHIKSLREKEKAAGHTINTLIKLLEYQLREAKNDDRDNNIAHLNVLSNGLEMYVTTVTKAAISAVRNDMKSRAIALTKVIAAVAKTPKELKEAYILEAAEDFDEIMNGEFNQGLIDDEARANIENLLKAAEE